MFCPVLGTLWVAVYDSDSRMSSNSCIIINTKQHKKIIMRGTSWKGILAGIIIVLALIGLSIVMIQTYPKTFKGYFGLEPVFGNPSEQEPVPNFNRNLPPGEHYAAVVKECPNGNCNDGTSPDSVCKSSPELGPAWHAFSVNCESLTGSQPDNTATFDKIWDDGQTEKAWCEDTGGEDMTVTCTDVGATDDLKIAFVDCHGDCKSSTPKEVCRNYVGNGWHAVSVNCEDIETADTSSRNIGDDWSSDSVAWCQDGDGIDMTVTCAKDDSSFPALADIKVAILEFNQDPRDAWGMSPNTFCTNTFGLKALNIDCSKIDIDHISNGVWGRYYTEPWSSGAQESVGWCERNDEYEKLDMTVSCYKAGTPQAQCADGQDNNNRNGIDFPTDECCRDANDFESVYQCCNRDDDNHNGLTDIEDPACHTDGNAANLDSYDPHDDSELSPAVPQCSDGIDNGDGDGKIDSNDPGCVDSCTGYNSNDNNEREQDDSLPSLELKSLIRECVGGSGGDDCRSNINLSPNDVCTKNISSDWAALGINCENIGFDRDHDSSKFPGQERTFDQVWNSSMVGWCQDTFGFDMEHVCFKKSCTSATLAQLRTLVIECDNIDCRNSNRKPEQLCIDKYGSGWHALAIDCDMIALKNVVGTEVRNLNKAWSGDSTGWCQDTSNDEDMTLLCTDRPISPDTDIKVVVVECDDVDCRTKGVSPDQYCTDNVGTDWRALFVDCEDINIDGQTRTLVPRTYDQIWNSNTVGWCEKSGDQDMAITCVKKSFSLYYYP